MSRGQNVGVGNLGDRQTIKGAGGRGRGERQHAGSTQTTRGLSELPHYITEEAPKHDIITTNSCSLTQQLPGAWGSFWSWCFSTLSAYIPWQSPSSQPHFTLHPPPSPSYQPHPDPSTCRIERTKLLQLLL